MDRKAAGFTCTGLSITLDPILRCIHGDDGLLLHMESSSKPSVPMTLFLGATGGKVSDRCVQCEPCFKNTDGGGKLTLVMGAFAMNPLLRLPFKLSTLPDMLRVFAIAMELAAMPPWRLLTEELDMDGGLPFI